MRKPYTFTKSRRLWAQAHEVQHVDRAGAIVGPKRREYVLRWVDVAGYACPPYLCYYADDSNGQETLWMKLAEGETFETARDAIMKRWRKARGEQ